MARHRSEVENDVCKSFRKPRNMITFRRRVYNDIERTYTYINNLNVLHYDIPTLIILKRLVVVEQ